MAGGMQGLDLNFPYPDEDKSTEEQLQEITDYLYSLLGNLKYILKNLGVNNFNETELTEISDTITKPINVQLGNVEGDVTELQVTADGLSTRVGSAEGNISSLQQTSNGLSVRVSNVESRNTVAINANGMYVTDQYGNTTTLTGNHIKSGVLEGVTLLSADASGHVVKIQNGSIVTGISAGTSVLSRGRFWYDGDKVYLMSDYGHPLKILGGDNLSIDARGTTYIGTSNNGENVSIGNSGGNVNLVGNVYINGVLQ